RSPQPDRAHGVLRAAPEAAAHQRAGAVANNSAESGCSGLLPGPPLDSDQYEARAAEDNANNRRRRPMSGLQSIDQTVQLTHIWINELDSALGWNNKPRSYRLLRCVLQALRDWLQVNEATDLAAQLPTLLRGVYYDQWRPQSTPVNERDQKIFIPRRDGYIFNDAI